MRRNRRVKIVATLGPATSSPEMVERLVIAGVDVFRINMSHASHATAQQLHAIVRDVADKHRHPIGILFDLQGPKFRLGEFHGGRVFVNEGATFRFDKSDAAGATDRVFLPHPQIFDAVKGGDMLLLDDGKIRMRVKDKSRTSIAAEVITGGALSSRKGISLPDTVLPISPLTEKDRADLDCALALGPDWIALSFVQKRSDVEEAKRIIGSRAALLAKIAGRVVALENGAAIELASGLDTPSGVAIGADGTVYVAESGGDHFRALAQRQLGGGLRFAPVR